MVAIIKKILGQRQLKKAGMETYGEKDTLQAHAAERKQKRQALINKGKQALKDYAAKAPERREARIKKLQQQAKIAEAEARLAKAKQKQQAARPAFGLSTGIAGPSIGIGPPPAAPAAKPKKRKKAKKRQVTISF